MNLLVDMNNLQLLDKKPQHYLDVSSYLGTGMRRGSLNSCFMKYVDVMKGIILENWTCFCKTGRV